MSSRCEISTNCVNNSIKPILKWTSNNSETYQWSFWHSHQDKELFWLFLHYHGEEGQKEGEGQQTPMVLLDYLYFPQVLSKWRKTLLLRITIYTVIHLWDDEEFIEGNKPTWWATARERSPRSANLSIIAWTFCLISALLYARLRIYTVYERS